MAMPILVWLISWVSSTISTSTRTGVMMTTSFVEVPTMVDGFVQNSDGGISHGLAAGDVGRSVFQQIADADGGDHDGHSRGVAQGLIGRPLNEKAQRHRQDDDNRNCRVDRQHGGNINHPAGRRP